MGGYPTEEDDLGAMLAGGNGGQPPAQGGGWTEMLNNPIARSALLSFGIQAMTGGWGNGTQQLGAALGAGATAAGATAEAMQKQTNTDEAKRIQQAQHSSTLASREREGALNRDSRAEIAGLQTQGRLEVAQERVRGMLERASMIHGPKTDNEWRFYQTQLSEARKTIEGDISSLQVPAAERERLIEARAKARLEEARGQGLFGGTSSVKGPTNAVQQNPGSPASAGSTAPGGPEPRTPAPKAGRTLDDLINHPVYGAKVMQDLQSIEGRARILQANPHLKDEIIRRFPKAEFN